MTKWIVALSVLAVYANAGIFLASWGLRWSVLLVNWKKRRKRSAIPHDDADGVQSDEMTRQGSDIYFSVHLPTHNEPSDIVIKTINSILASDYSHFELLVIDNNTSDNDLWMPVRDFCLDKGPRLRFYHCMNVKNAKAGALNIARGLCDRQATHVVIVDADYTVHTDFLSRAVSQLSQARYDYLQFPQSYRGKGAGGLKNELGLYFSTVSKAADAANTMLLTGTLSVISVEALNCLGGWNTTTLTEDAEIGLQLHMRGFRGRYIGQPAGAGLLPFTFADLEKQRERWIHGNFQVLTRYFMQIMTVKKTYMLAILCQLSAWFAYLLVPMIFLLLVPFQMGSRPLPEFARWGATVAAATIILDFLARFIFIWLSGIGPTLVAVVNAFIASWSLAGASSLATFTGYLPVAKTFHRTNKSICESSIATSDSKKTLVVALLGLIVMAKALYAGMLWIAIAGLLAVLMLPFQWVLSHHLRQYCSHFRFGQKDERR
ncbi:hypothetical protein W822_05665 [Advenella kashmirensis W13003]|uniref:Glycosyltransferase 2-like domain-containing protein n=1 Tax=Advenella kashmirensis W13003 TaxID=1424334 RepID=V8QVG3_9BURK|nr:glycosyltransferase family 2 protein [Advenella kashmirensis]ETF03622.1 hypothetical protein W822_05665 [Advenella kashmirensis W13003]